MASPPRGRTPLLGGFEPPWREGCIKTYAKTARSLLLMCLVSTAGSHSKQCGLDKKVARLRTQATGQERVSLLSQTIIPLFASPHRYFILKETRRANALHRHRTGSSL